MTEDVQWFGCSVWTIGASSVERQNRCEPCFDWAFKVERFCSNIFWYVPTSAAGEIIFQIFIWQNNKTPLTVITFARTESWSVQNGGSCHNLFKQSWDRNGRRDKNGAGYRKKRKWMKSMFCSTSSSQLTSMFAVGCSPTCPAGSQAFIKFSQPNISYWRISGPYTVSH